MEQAIFLGNSTRIYHPGINMPPKQTVPLVRPSVANRHIVNAMFAKAWAVAVVMG
jgi:hypothetical protein